MEILCSELINCYYITYLPDLIEIQKFQNSKSKKLTNKCFVQILNPLLKVIISMKFSKQHIISNQETFNSYYYLRKDEKNIYQYCNKFIIIKTCTSNWYNLIFFLIYKITNIVLKQLVQTRINTTHLVKMLMDINIRYYHFSNPIVSNKSSLFQSKFW